MTDETNVTQCHLFNPC